MEKSRMEFLSGIQETLSELKARIAEIESKLAEEEAAAEAAEAAAAEAAAEAAAAKEAAEAAAAAEAEAAAEAAEAEAMSPIDISIDIDDIDAELTAAGAPEPEVPQAPALAPAPKASINDRQEKRVKKSVMDVMSQKLAWKTAIPGTPVKNVISAISLNDRVLFINTLFKEDPIAFQEAIAAFNAMSSFDEAEEYVSTHHPDWNLNSDLVYRLMMAVRRKLR